jgi:hypothetical protein
VAGPGRGADPGAEEREGQFRANRVAGLVALIVLAVVVVLLWTTYRSGPGASPGPPEPPPSAGQSPGGVEPQPVPLPRPRIATRSSTLKPVEVGLWALYFTMMLLGMVGQYMFRLKNWSRFELHEFLTPLWVSIFVFTPFWTSLASYDTVTYSAAALAYQNGFFWKLLVDEFGRKSKRDVAKALKSSTRDSGPKEKLKGHKY